jgi:hypothetical protein
MKSRILIILFFLNLISQHIFSVENYVVSFYPMEINNLDENYYHIANSLPLQLYSELQNIPTHQYSDEEILNLKKNSLNNLLITYSTVLSHLKEKYDNYIFSNNFNTDEYELLKKEIHNQKLLIDNLDINKLPNPESTAPVEALSINESTSNTNSLEQENPDLIIKGVLDKLDNWIYLEIWVENVINNDQNLVYKSVYTPDKLTDSVTEISKILKTLILGRSWSSLLFDLEPKASNIVVRNENGQVIHKDYEYLNAGTYSIEINKQGYNTEYSTATIQEFETKSINIVLNKKSESIVSLQSFPSGADLYSGATWIGKTPLLFNKPIIPALLTLKLEGYNDSRYIYEDESGRDLQIFLHSTFVLNDMVIKNKRNNFYKSFSYFLLSLPVSMLSFGMSSDYGYAYNREVLLLPNSSESDRLMSLSTTWYNVYLSSLYINIILFVNTVFDLVEYIKSNNYL